MTPEEQSLRDEIKRRLEYYSPKINKADRGLTVSIRNKEFLLQSVSSQVGGDRRIS
jgi:hypothetical protein